jgi:hypothetical protein
MAARRPILFFRPVLGFEFRFRLERVKAVMRKFR